MSAEALSQWLNRPPGSWTADDLDRLPPEAPRCEVLDGALVVMSPQRNFHARMMRRLANAIEDAAPVGWHTDIEMSVRIDRRNRLEPDVAVICPVVELDEVRTYFLAEQVALAVEIASPESRQRDRVIKPHKYARAGIPHYWLVERDHGTTVVRVFDLDADSSAYRQVAVERQKLTVGEPFPVTIDAERLWP